MPHVGISRVRLSSLSWLSEQGNHPRPDPWFARLVWPQATEIEAHRPPHAKLASIHMHFFIELSLWTLEEPMGFRPFPVAYAGTLLVLAEKQLTLTSN
jgi:hypothetical protein